MRINDILNIKIENKYWRGRIIEISNDEVHLKKIGGKSKIIRHNPKVFNQNGEFWEMNL